MVNRYIFTYIFKTSSKDERLNVGKDAGRFCVIVLPL